MKIHYVVRLAAALAGTVSLAAAVPATAHAEPVPDRSTTRAAGQADATYVVNTFKNRATKRCLDDSNTYGLRTYACNTSPLPEVVLSPSRP